jgi:hypothetical protein
MLKYSLSILLLRSERRTANGKELKMSNDAEEFVSVLVPRKHVTRVYGLIASLEQHRSGDSDLATMRSQTKEEQWPRDLIERQYRESPDSMKIFQKYLADHQGEEFSTTEMATALDAAHGWNTIAGQLGAYGRRIKNRYERDSFPFESRWDHEKGEQYHSMTPQVAEIIKSL